MKIILSLLFVLGLTYSYTDRQLYFYGKNDLNIHHPLPISVKPNYWGHDLGNLGFVLVDDLDFVVIGKGNKYKSSEIIVDEIIKYGFDKKRIITTVVDSLGREHLLTLQSGDKSDIEVFVDAKNDYNELTWIEIKGKDKYVRQLEWIRSFIRIGLFILVIVVGFRLVRALSQGVRTPTTGMRKN